jgi:hypothetical protein
MKMNKTGLAIAGLLAICLILAAGVFTLGQPPKAEDNATVPGDTLKDVEPSGIPGPGAAADVPDDTDVEPTVTPGVEPAGIPASTPSADTGTVRDIPLTVISERPKPPEPPAGHQQEHSEDTEQHEKPSDPALMNPDVKPDSAPIPAEPTPQDAAPQSGDHNNNGEVYIPGFGWVKDEGGGGQGQPSGSDGDWDKIIGY